MKEKFIKTLEDSIKNSKYRSAFAISDFMHISNNYETLKKSIARLEKKGKIIRIIRGIYFMPVYNKFFEEKTTFDPYDVCLCIARKNEWDIAPYGESALNLMHLSTQMPNSYIFASSGPNAKFKIKNFCIQFKHRSPKEIYNFSSTSRLVIQCLKAQGRKNINNETIKTISSNLTNSQKRILNQESKRMMLWIKNVVNKIIKYE